jgi:hypothetical protein
VVEHYDVFNRVNGATQQCYYLCSVSGCFPELVVYIRKAVCEVKSLSEREVLYASFLPLFLEGIAGLREVSR